MKENSLELSEGWKKDKSISEAYEEFRKGEISQVSSLGTVLIEG